MSDEAFLTSFSDDPGCSVVIMLEYDQRCDYVRKTEACTRMGKLGSYIEILFCKLKPHNDTEQILCSCFLMTICVLIYIVLGCTVENFFTTWSLVGTINIFICIFYKKLYYLNFCPALKVVSKMLGLNEHLAGVTLLAFGNGAPDMIGSFSDFGRGPMFPDLFGAGVYVVLLVSGLICVFYPFELQWNNVLRDACFLSFGIIYVDYCCVSDGVVTRTEAVSIMSVYILYLMVIFIEQFLLKQSVKMLQSKLKDRKYATAANLAKLEQLRAEAGIEILDRTSRLSIDVNRTRTMSFDAVLNKPNKDLFKQFFESLNPIQKEEWLESGIAEKIYLVITAPLLLVLQFFIPIVDYEKERHGWSKLLNSIQIPWIPMIIIYIFSKNVFILGIPLCCYTLLITIPITAYMLYTTRTDIPPNYHHSTALYGVASSIIVIYFSATESVEILRVIGIVTNRSDSFLGCTLQAWGNSIGDLVSTIALARHGYPRMGYAACFGGPFFNSIASFGGVFIYETFRTETPLFVPQGALGENCVVFLFIATISVLIWSTLTNFSARRSIGIFNFILYAIFLVFVFLGESEVIETFEPENEEEIIDD